MDRFVREEFNGAPIVKDTKTGCTFSFGQIAVSRTFLRFSGTVMDVVAGPVGAHSVTKMAQSHSVNFIDSALAAAGLAVIAYSASLFISSHNITRLLRTEQPKKA